MSKKEFKEFKELRERLEMQREEVRQLLSRLEQETRSLDVDVPQDSADRSVINLSKETLFEQGSQRRGLLRRIEGAIERIQKGSFGTCLGCGQQIAVRRLQALPWTQYCLKCQEMIERGSEDDLSAVSSRLSKRAG
jgi:RNA polymerase-binding transcription factor